jgi:tetratricopeptide (TPR) repeat protein
MKRRKKSNGCLRFLSLLVLAFLGAALALGSFRYGGPSGLWRRAQAEVAAWQPGRPPGAALVPTPLSVPLEAEPVQLSFIPDVELSEIRQAIAPVAAYAEQLAKATSITTTLTNSPAPPRRRTVSLLPTPTPDPVLSQLHYIPAAASADLAGFRHAWQTWNNCGPATLATYLSYFGSTLDQAAIGGVLRTHQDDKNVLPEELVAYAQAQGFEAALLINGNSDRLRTLITNGIPVLVETWLEDEPDDGMGHYRLLTGYDDASSRWIAYDSYARHDLRNPDPNGAYQGIYFAYDQFEAWWKVFNRTYVLIYPAEKAQLVREIVGNDIEPARMWQTALRQAEATVSQTPNDAFAWFNLGTNLVALGRYEAAAAVYDQARRVGLPWRMLWYQFGPFQAYYESGRHQEVIALADSVIRTTTSIEEPYYWRGQAAAALGNPGAAQQDWQRALRLNSNYAPASQALAAMTN